MPAPRQERFPFLRRGSSGGQPTCELRGKLDREEKRTPNSQCARDQKHHFWEKSDGPEHLVHDANFCPVTPLTTQEVSSSQRQVITECNDQPRKGMF